MSQSYEFLARVLAIGVGATLVMDLWAALLRRVGVRSLDFALLGRWIGSWRRGRWSHADISRAEPVRGERAIGWAAHYSIGVAFAGLLVSVFGLGWARAPSPLPALWIGLVTAAAPLLVLQPALGAGIASSKTPRPWFNAGKSVVTHAVYGLGLYAAAWLGAALWPGA